MKNKQGGFVEVLVVLVIVGILGSVVFGALSRTPNPPAPKNEVQTSNDIQKKVVANVPIPNIETSMERVNVAKRAELFNKEDKVSYIYLVNYGKVMAFYTVKGKVSSLRSYMSPMDKIVDYKGNPCSYSTSSCYTVEAPDIDGTYGENMSGIFFFTTEGAYVEWVGDYMMSDQPLRLSTTPELVRTIK